jgi:hypothetical protein
VLVVWYGDRFSLVHSTSVCLRAKSTKTNRDGSFATSSWWGRPRFMALTGVRAVIFVAKEGHAHVVQRQGEPPWPAEPGVHLLYRVEDSTEWPVDRFLSGSCPPAIFEPPA